MICSRILFWFVVVAVLPSCTLLHDRRLTSSFYDDVVTIEKKESNRVDSAKRYVEQSSERSDWYVGVAESTARENIDLAVFSWLQSSTFTKMDQSRQRDFISRMSAKHGNLYSIEQINHSLKLR